VKNYQRIIKSVLSAILRLIMMSLMAGVLFIFLNSQYLILRIVTIVIMIIAIILYYAKEFYDKLD